MYVWHLPSLTASTPSSHRIQDLSVLKGTEETNCPQRGRQLQTPRPRVRILNLNYVGLWMTNGWIGETVKKTVASTGGSHRRELLKGAKMTFHGLGVLVFCTILCGSLVAPQGTDVAPGRVRSAVYPFSVTFKTSNSSEHR